MKNILAAAALTVLALQVIAKSDFSRRRVFEMPACHVSAARRATMK